MDARIVARLSEGGFGVVGLEDDGVVGGARGVNECG
jgi:hypothetical protein